MSNSNENKLLDSYNRVASKLRISVTDKCNFRCNFCMPDNPVWLPQHELLTFEEIHRLVTVFAKLGINKVRLSGGEPLLRNEIEKLVKMLVDINGISKVSITTNGILLSNKVESLKKSGLDSVTISLHSLKKNRFEQITGTKNTFDNVLTSITNAQECNLEVKINTVVIKNCNEDEILDFTKLAYTSGLTVRFIEYMPFDGNKLWGVDKVISEKQIIKLISKVYQLYPIPREFGSTANLYSFDKNSKGKIGIISSMTKPFCGDCDRVRLSANGHLVPCLFSSNEYDMKSLLRQGVNDLTLCNFIKSCYLKKSPGIETMLKTQIIEHVRPMHTIGG